VTVFLKVICFDQYDWAELVADERPERLHN
jgi:hypothetical protein